MPNEQRTIVESTVTNDYNLKLLTHSIRHSILTHLRLKGYRLEDLQLLAGHEDIGTTQRTYVHVGLDEVRGKFDEFHTAQIEDQIH